MRIDAHQHFWKYDPVEYDWMGDGMDVLRFDRLPADLSPLLQSARLDGSVAVQARSTLEETEWLLQLADQNPFIKGVVGWVDLCSPDARSQLERVSASQRLCGVRHIVQSEPDDGFMLRQDFRRGISLLAEFGLAYDILVFPRHLPAAYELVTAFPNQVFVLDHIAKPFIKEHVVSPWEAEIRRLASLPNVCGKVSGLVTEADWKNWKPADFFPYLDVVFEAFGPQRVMFGSDWPVCTLAGNYADVTVLIEEYTRQLSAQELAQVWGGTAEKAYRLQP
jgi:L-fuconolactonase